MAIRQVKELPTRAGNRYTGESYVAKDVREFVRLGYGVALVEYPNVKPDALKRALVVYIKRNQDTCAGISVCIRKGRVYMVRSDA